MTKITESTIELFEKLGYEYICAPSTGPDKVNGKAREEVLL